MDGKNLFLTLNDVADELGTDTLRILRLIALGNLKATRLGEDGERRVTREALTDFVTRGAPGLPGPEFSDGWFKTINRNEVQKFPARTIASAMGQFLSDADVAKKADPKLTYQSFEVALIKSAELEQFLRSTYMPDVVLPNKEIPQITWKEFFSRSRLIDTMEHFLRSQAVEDMNLSFAGVNAKLTRLYDDRDNLNATIEATADAILRGEFREKVRYQYKNPETQELRTVVVEYVLPVASWLTRNEIIAAAAFVV